MVEEPFTKSSPSEYIDFSKLSFLQSWQLESRAIGESLMGTTLESFLIVANLFWPDWIDSVGNVNRFNGDMNRFNGESIQLCSESIQLCSESIHWWIDSVVMWIDSMVNRFISAVNRFNDFLQQTWLFFLLGFIPHVRVALCFVPVPVSC